MYVIIYNIIVYVCFSVIVYSTSNFIKIITVHDAKKREIMQHCYGWPAFCVTGTVHYGNLYHVYKKSYF